MTKQETIQVLQSIEDRAIDFPNMTECDWVAIAAAKRHLQEEPVSEDLEEEIEEYWKNAPTGTVYFPMWEHFQIIAHHFAEWGKKQAEIEIQAQSMALAHGCPKEPVSDELEEAAIAYNKKVNFVVVGNIPNEHFIAGAKWQKTNLWKPADGDELPEYDREVIAILDYDFGHYKVVYAHRPNPNGWDGTNIDTGEKEHFEPATYGKGGWNQPHILYWLDARLPYEEK